MGCKMKFKYFLMLLLFALFFILRFYASKATVTNRLSKNQSKFLLVIYFLITVLILMIAFSN